MGQSQNPQGLFLVFTEDAFSWKLFGFMVACVWPTTRSWSTSNSFNKHFLAMTSTTPSIQNHSNNDAHPPGTPEITWFLIFSSIFSSPELHSSENLKPKNKKIGGLRPPERSCWHQLPCRVPRPPGRGPGTGLPGGAYCSRCRTRGEAQRWREGSQKMSLFKLFWKVAILFLFVSILCVFLVGVLFWFGFAHVDGVVWWFGASGCLSVGGETMGWVPAFLKVTQKLRRPQAVGSRAKMSIWSCGQEVCSSSLEGLESLLIQYSHLQVLNTSWY